MHTSLLFESRYDVNINSTQKFELLESEYNTNEIIMLRFRFQNYTAQDTIYIKKMENIFDKACIVIEINILDKDGFEALIQSGLTHRVAVMLLIPIRQQEIESCDYGEKEYELIQYRYHDFIDRIILSDSTGTLEDSVADKIATNLSNHLRIKKTSIGICNLNHVKNNKQSIQPCLTSTIYEDLLKKYTPHSDRHPHLEFDSICPCGCVPFLIVSEPLFSTVNVKEVTSVKSSEKTIKIGASGNVKSKRLRGIRKWK